MDTYGTYVSTSTAGRKNSSYSRKILTNATRTGLYTVFPLAHFTLIFCLFLLPLINMLKILNTNSYSNLTSTYPPLSLSLSLSLSLCSL